MIERKLRVDYISVNDIKEYENNAKEHPDWQIEQIANSIRAFGFNDPLALDEDNQIIEGHGRYLAAKRMAMKKVPCIYLKGLSEDEKRAYIITHNKLTMNTGFDLEVLEYELNSLKVQNFDLGLTGFTNSELDDLLEKSKQELEDFETEEKDRLDNDYSLKIEAPIYEPKNEKPEISEMVDYTKYNQLIEEIENRKDISEEEKKFLKFAATRHIVFNYEKIADYYANSDKNTQELMENSALVIIDFEKALENGFVQMSKETMQEFGADCDE